MDLSAYRQLLGLREVRRILLLGAVVRIPVFAAAVVLTLHVVSHLDRSYAAAGLVETVYAGALALSGPWRGRRLDRIGLRATVGPSILVLGACWAVAPWVGYLPLLALVAVAGLFIVPHFSIVRQVLIGVVPEEQRTAALSLDSVVVEISFGIGPVLGVIGATTLPTPVALVVFQALSVAGAVCMWVVDPPLGHAASPATGRAAGDDDGRAVAAPAVRSWLTPTVVGVLVVAFTATLVLTGEDLGTVAALREMGHTSSIGWVLGLWALSSAIGGLVYGALSRHPPSSVLIALLAGSALLVPLAQDRWQFAALLFLTGFFCAPTITATVDDLTRAVPAAVRGEALGWQGSALTLGASLGAPATGVAIDARGWTGAFPVVGTLGLAIAVVTFAVTARIRRQPVDAGAPVDVRS